MLFHFRNIFPQLNAYWDKYLPYQARVELPAKSILLEEGKVSQQYIFIEKGCIRVFFNHKGDEKTVQFFFENEGLASLESFLNSTPSQVSIQTIEPSVLYLLPREQVTRLFAELAHEPDFVQMILQSVAQRQMHYINEFVSFIRDTPEERYKKLVAERPHIVQRMPQHYIASYLGVSTVHLSRIKRKIASGKAQF